MYYIGARKMLIFQIGPIGCFPYIIKRFKPTSRCDEKANKLVSIFNDKLNVKIRELSHKLTNSNFVVVETFHLIKDMVKNPTKYGESISCEKYYEKQVPCQMFLQLQH